MAAGNPRNGHVSMADYDVAICGAGAAGLTLANMLGSQGLRTIVIDKQSRPRNVHKGEVIQPRSLEIFKDLGLLAPLHASGALAMERLVAAGASGRETMALDYRVLPGEFRHCLVHYYKDMSEIMAAQVAPSVEFCRGMTADGLLHDRAGRISGVRLHRGDERREVTAVLTVAADGRVSRLRRAAGIDVAMHPYDHQLVSLDIGDMPDLGNDIIMYLTGKGARVIFQMPGRRARLYAQIPVGGFRDIGRPRLREWITRLATSLSPLAPLSEVLGRNVSDVQVMSAWQFNAQVWARPGLILLGDAAHCVHPMVGQGMNAAIRDAWELGSQLAATGRFTTRTADTAVSRYEEARRPQVEYVARLSHNLATLFAARSLAAKTVYPFMLRRNRSNARLRYRITYNVAGLGSQPFSTWDWISASGLLPDPQRRRTLASDCAPTAPENRERLPMATVEKPTVPLRPADPWSLIQEYAALRSVGHLAVVRLPSGDEALLATRHEDVEAILGDSRFSTDMGRPGAARIFNDEAQGVSGNDHRPFADPPEHTRWRKLLVKAFTPRQVELMRPRAQQIVDGLVADIKESGPPADLMSKFAVRLSIRVVLGIMGFPSIDVERFGVWLDTAFAISGPTPDEKLNAMAEMAGYTTDLIAAKRADLTDDLTSRLIAVHDEDDDRLNDNELMMTVLILIIGGYENTARQMGRALMALFRHPEQMEKLRADPSLMPSAVEEVLRFAVFDTAIGNPRFATEEIVINGSRVPEGATVLLQRQSANWDDRHFSEPDKFRIDRRQEDRHFAFGYGAHYCVGAALARMELQVGLEGLLGQFPSLALAVPADEVPWEYRVIASGPQSLPVTW